MPYEVVSTAEFDAGLDLAVAHRIDVQGKRSARRLLEEVDKASELLSTTPRMGSLVNQREDDPRPDALRWVRADSYIIVYRPHEDDCVISLNKLFFASSNWRTRVSGE